jgi:hypothetical protein
LKMGIQEIYYEGVDWIYLAHWWWALDNAVMNHLVS